MDTTLRVVLAVTSDTNAASSTNGQKPPKRSARQAKVDVELDGFSLPLKVDNQDTLAPKTIAIVELEGGPDVVHFAMSKKSLSGKTVKVADIRDKIKSALGATTSKIGMDIGKGDQFVGLSFINTDADGNHVSSDLFAGDAEIPHDRIKDLISVDAEERFTIAMLHIRNSSWTATSYSIPFLDQPAKKAAPKGVSSIFKLLSQIETLEITNNAQKAELRAAKEELRKVKTSAREDQEVNKRGTRKDSKKADNLEQQLEAANAKLAAKDEELRALNAKASKMQEEAKNMASHAQAMRGDIGSIDGHLKDLNEAGKRMSEIV